MTHKPYSPPLLIKLPLYASTVRAGFPSPADDYQESTLDLNQFVVTHPSATYFVRASGSSMEGCGIYSGDLLIVNRALTPQHGDVVIAAIDGELTCKILDLNNSELRSANPQFPSIPITLEMDLIIEGVVSFSLRQHRVRSN